MSTLTPNLSLVLPAGADPADIAVINGNMTLLDTKIGKGTPSTAAVTVANTTTETILHTHTIPANTIAVGNVFKLLVMGVASVTLTPTLTFRLRVGGIAGQVIGVVVVTAASGVTSKNFMVESYAINITTGVTGTFNGGLVCVNELNTVFPSAADVSTFTATETANTTASLDFVVTAQWSAASASNTLTTSWKYGKREV